MLKYELTALIILLFFSVSLRAQKNSGSFEILEVVVEGTEVSPEVVKISSGLSKGKVIFGEDIQSAIKKLWKLNLFSDVAIDVTQAETNKVFLKIILEDYPRLNNVKVTGYDEYGKDDIEPLIKLQKGQILKSNNIAEVERAIKDFYNSKNYLLTEIESKTERVNEKQVDLTINITEGKEIFIKEIRFSENVFFKSDDLLDRFEETHEDRWWRDGEYNREKFESDLQLMTDYAKNKGFKDFEVVKDSVYYDEKMENIYIDITVNEGNKYYFGESKFAGNSLFSDEELIDALEYESGDEFSTEKLEMSIYNNLSTMYMDKGYLRANIIPEEQMTGTDTVSYLFKITEGTRARIRKIDFEGNTRTNEKVLRREMDIYPGDIFSKTKILRSQRNAMILNYFENVVPDMKPVDDKEVDLVFSIKEKPTEQAQTSIAYSEADGFIGSVGLVFNNFSFQHPFAQGDGQQLSTNIEFGKDYYKYTLSVEEPWLYDTPTMVGLSGNYQNRDDSYSDTQIISGVLKLGRRFAWSDNWMRGLWYYSIDRIKYTNISDNAPDQYELFEGKTIISSSLTEYLIRDSRDRADFPTRGSNLTLMTKLAGGILGGDEEFHKHKLDMKWYQPLVQNRFVLYSQFVVGLMDKLKESSYISSREYFYLGGGGLSGGEPLRGYDENSVGPYESGYFVGGRNLFKTSFELRLKLVETPMLIYSLAYFDAGNLWRDYTEVSLFDLRKGAGLGVRINVPMLGMMGLDVGYGFDYFESFGKKADWSDQLRTHFRMGTNL
ncbi:TPA: outer membrane protein assembly factor BamA [Candidatus Delongbacteria bacterium]|nr:MAG: outer membrane protein assembly factor BamA [Candidatus Delongbacteria bacterium GWF2_40_14]HAQ62046.1 outer membrane protein assembly factor BamA [Candidatus Delongbacteria bacterium]